MSYSITSHSRTAAKALGVTIKRATNKKKKLDVFKMDKKKKKLVKVASIGSIGYGDYGTFKKTKGIEFANKRRAAYKKRHSKNRSVVGSNGYYADKILW